MYMVEKNDKLTCCKVLGMLLIILCICVSCGHKEVRTALDMAEKQMWDEPDSALKVLESIIMPEALEGKERADYALLLTQAQYRSNIIATSDSLINIAVEYYQDKDVEKRTASLLYKGGVLKDMGKDEEAMLAYKEAESYIPRIKDNKITSFIYTGLGYLNQKHDNYGLAVSYFKKAILINTHECQLEWKASNLMNVANIEYGWGNKDSANLYYSDLLEMIPSVDSTLQSKIYYNIGANLKKEEKWMEAEEYLREALIRQTHKTNYKTLLLLADIYSKKGYREKVDSLWQCALDKSDLEIKAKIYYSWYVEASQKNDYKNALSNLSNFISLTDSIRNRVNQVELLAMQKKYDRAVLINKNAEIRNHWYLTILISITTIIILIGSIYLILIINRRNNKKLLLRNMQEKAELQARIDANQIKIAEDDTMHNGEKEKLQLQIVQLEAEKKQKDVSIRRLEIICKSKDKDIPLEYIEALEVIMKLKSKELPSYDPAVDREKLHIWLDLVYNNFASRLLERYQLTGRERDVCYLKALDFSDDEISDLLKIQLRSEERWIYRICEKFGFSKGSKDDFTTYILELREIR